MNITTNRKPFSQANCYRRVRARSPRDQAAIDADRLRAPLWKRFLDVGLIVATAPAWAPLMVAIGAAIKLVSSGPLLFRQERVGLKGTSFVCLKFRTMRTGAPTNGHENYFAELIRTNRPMTKLDGADPRLIPLGWLLRSTGLDELPQLFNVFRGDMSLVGPRPCTPKEYSAYSLQQQARSRTLPGLTGLWQVQGKNHTTFNEMIELDIRYITNLSPWFDIRIMLRTPVVLFAQVAETILSRKLKASTPNDAFPTQPRKNAPHGSGMEKSSDQPSSLSRAPRPVGQFSSDLIPSIRFQGNSARQGEFAESTGTTGGTAMKASPSRRVRFRTDETVRSVAGAGWASPQPSPALLNLRPVQVSRDATLDARHRYFPRT